MYLRVAIIVAVLSSGCANLTDYSEKNYSYDPLQETLKHNGYCNLSFKKCSSPSDSCTLIKFKLKEGLLIESDNLGTRGAAVIQYDSIIPVPIYFQPSKKYKQATFTAEIKQYKNITSLYWYEKPLSELLDSTTYFFNGQGRIIKIHNNIDFFNLFTRVKIWGGFTNVCIVDSFSYDKNDLVKERFTTYVVRNERTDLYNSTPISTKYSYTYSKQGELSEIIMTHQFIDKTQNYQSILILENGEPKFFKEKGKVYFIEKGSEK